MAVVVLRSVAVARHTRWRQKLVGGATKFEPEISTLKAQEGLAGEEVYAKFFDMASFQRELRAPVEVEIRIPASEQVAARMVKQSSFNSNSQPNTHEEDSTAQDIEFAHETSAIEKLRAVLAGETDAGAQAWLGALATIAAHADGPVEVFMAHSVPGCWLRTRLRAQQEKLDVRTSLRPVPQALPAVVIRAETKARQGAMPGWVLDATATLHRDGRLSGVNVMGTSDGLPEPLPELAMELANLGRPPSMAALEALCQRFPLATVQWVAAEMRAMEVFLMDEHRGVPKFGEWVVEEEDAPSDRRRRDESESDSDEQELAQPEGEPLEESMVFRINPTAKPEGLRPTFDLEWTDAWLPSLSSENATGAKEGKLKADLHRMEQILCFLLNSRANKASDPLNPPGKTARRARKEGKNLTDLFKERNETKKRGSSKSSVRAL